MNKYDLTDETIEYGDVTLRRIRALKSFGDVCEGDLGGYVESEWNLSHNGNCWIDDNALVYGNARVFDNAKVCGEVIVHGNVKVFGNTSIDGNAEVCGDGTLFGNVIIKRDEAFV